MNKKQEKNVKKWMLDHRDLIDFCLEIAHNSLRDRLIYGYNPWDYLEESKINIKLQLGKIK